MGNLQSSDRYDKDTLIRTLWKALRAIPVLPINPRLAPLRVLTKANDGYHDVGSVYSLCKPGADKDSLRGFVSPGFIRTFVGLGKKKYFTTESIGTQTCKISVDHGAMAKLLVGEANAAAWFSRAKSIEVHIPECCVCEFRNENWEEMLRRFDPDMTNTLLGKPEWNSKRKLIIVQKVVLVSHVQITARYSNTAGMNFQLPQVVRGVVAQARVHDKETVVFTLSATKKDQKLPIAFSGIQYTYDKFGVREEKQEKRTRNQPDTAASSSHGEGNENDEDDEVVSEEDTEANEDMGDFFEGEDDDWCISIVSSHGQDEEDDDLAQNPASHAGSLPRSPEEIQ